LFLNEIRFKGLSLHIAKFIVKVFSRSNAPAGLGFRRVAGGAGFLFVFALVRGATASAALFGRRWRHLPRYRVGIWFFWLFLSFIVECPEVLPQSGGSIFYAPFGLYVVGGFFLCGFGGFGCVYYTGNFFYTIGKCGQGKPKYGGGSNRLI